MSPIVPSNLLRQRLGPLLGAGFALVSPAALGTEAMAAEPPAGAGLAIGAALIGGLLIGAGLRA